MTGRRKVAEFGRPQVQAAADGVRLRLMTSSNFPKVDAWRQLPLERALDQNPFAIDAAQLSYIPLNGTTFAKADFDENSAAIFAVREHEAQLEAFATVEVQAHGSVLKLDPLDGLPDWAPLLDALRREVGNGAASAGDTEFPIHNGPGWQTGTVLLREDEFVASREEVDLLGATRRAARAGEAGRTGQPVDERGLTDVGASREGDLGQPQQGRRAAGAHRPGEPPLRASRRTGQAQTARAGWGTLETILPSSARYFLIAFMRFANCSLIAERSTSCGIGNGSLFLWVAV